MFVYFFVYGAKAESFMVIIMLLMHFKEKIMSKKAIQQYNLEITLIQSQILEDIQEYFKFSLN